MALDLGTWLGVVGLGVTFLLWGTDKILDAYDRSYAATPPNEGKYQKARRTVHQILTPMRWALGIAFFIYGLYVIFVLA